MYSSKIIETGRYVPDHIVKNADLSIVVDTSDEWIRSRTGIGERRISLMDTTSDMASKAALHILEKNNRDPLDIDLIIVATITPDYMMPSTACLVQSKIGAKNAFAFDISAACSGFVFGLSTADKFIKAGTCKNALVIGAEMLSKTVDWEDRSTCVLFGDGAAGVLLTRCSERRFLGEEMGSDGTRGLSLTSGYTAPANIFNEKERTEPSTMEMDGREIFKFATKTLPVSLEKIIRESQIEIEDLKWIVLHQANERIIEAVAKKISIPLDKFYRNMFHYGNTSSASIPIALDEMNEKGLIQKGDKLLLSGFGGGLTWGSLLIEW